MTLADCQRLLTDTSRTFAMWSRTFPSPECDYVCVCYLVLRALDSLEDDVEVPVAERAARCRSFHESLGDEAVTFDCSMPVYKELMNRFGELVVPVLAGLPADVRLTIQGLARDMGADMARFLEQPIESWEDYDEYCYAVAGRTGPVLFRWTSKTEGETDEDDATIAIGKFLQRVNIIRDVREDILENKRFFWPRVVVPEPENLLSLPSSDRGGLSILNLMVDEAMRFVRGSSIFVKSKPGIIGLVLAGMSLLVELYGNTAVYEGSVKMKRDVFVSCLLLPWSQPEAAAKADEIYNDYQRAVTEFDKNNAGS